MKLILLGLLVCTQQLFAQNSPQTVTEYDSISKIIPKEKLYLHVDKSVYAPSDTLWFKAYLINPSTNAYSAQSGLIYVDMVDMKGSVVQSLSLPTKFGISWGSLVLNPKVYKGGTYTLRGYTNWMQNFGDTYIFKKLIKVVSVSMNNPTPTSASSNLGTVKKTPTNNTISPQDPSIQFLPEGGNWVVGRLQKIAFKAIAANGIGIAIEGEVKDSKQNLVSTFKSNSKGMGYFSAIAEPNETYTAVIKTKNGSYTQLLPKTKLSGTTLIVKNDYALDSLVISVLSDLSNQALTMIGQSKGLVCFSANFPPDTKRRTIKIPKKLFPTGVSQIILQNQDQVLNERNFFINHQDQLQIGLSTNAANFSVRDSIPISINVNDADKKPVGGSFSIAITDDNQVQKDELRNDNILSYFLLSSDLKGEIEEPASYFSNFNAQRHDDLDALCLTQGWVNYNWDLNNKPKYQVEKEYTISGKITNLANKPVPNAKISILGRNKVMMFGDTTTNEKGEFVFKNLPPLDSAMFVLKVLNSKGKLGSLGFEVNEFKPLPTKATKIVLAKSDQQLDSIELNFVATKQQEFKATNRGTGIELKEVVITGKKIIKGSKNLNGPGEADQTITTEDLEKAGKKTLMTVLKEQVKGFTEGFRRRSLIYDYFLNFNRLKLIIDGIDVDLSYIAEDKTGFTDFSHFRHLKTYLDYYTAEDLVGIEVMRNIGNATAYKVAYDTIENPQEISFLEITTRGGDGPFLKKTPNAYVVKPMNYGDTKTFYSPKYTSANKTNKNLDLRSTLYWAPNVVTNTKGEANVSFYSSDKKGSYTVWVEGSDMQGKFGIKTMKLRIK